MFINLCVNDSFVLLKWDSSFRSRAGLLTKRAKMLAQLVKISKWTELITNRRETLSFEFWFDIQDLNFPFKFKENGSMSHILILLVDLDPKFRAHYKVRLKPIFQPRETSKAGMTTNIYSLSSTILYYIHQKNSIRQVTHIWSRV